MKQWATPKPGGPSLTIIEGASICSSALELDSDDMANSLVNELDWDADGSHDDSIPRRIRFRR